MPKRSHLFNTHYLSTVIGVNASSLVVGAIYSWFSVSGITFLWENMDRLQDEDADRMPIGFEVAFPSLIEIGRSLDLDVPYDALALRDIYAKRAFKLKRYIALPPP